jgi:hypothetical protein
MDLLLTDIRVTHSRAMDTQATPLTPVPPVMHIRAIRDCPLTLDLQPMGSKPDRHTLPIPVLVMDIPCLDIRAIALRKYGIEPSS